ncbi:uncharacterized protein LOC143296648 [Babylonia areolata]|uniref:uncharacterized protein LOC143296648 n=1 Tax=Babylonia areolata TaxID=304850 RepID=UPI003FD4FF33
MADSRRRTAPSREEWLSKIQIHGILHKFGQQSNKWNKRFFLVRDGFMMYYAEQEKKDFEKREYFNKHPKGIIPLGKCRLTAVPDAVHPFCLSIESQELEGGLLLAADTAFERDRWLDILEKSRRVTWQNTTLSDEMIRKLEDDSVMMAREKQDYFDRLLSETNALSEERMRAEELEKINSELEKEKQKLETFTSEIQDEYERIRVELEDTILLMRDIEDEKRELNDVLQAQSQQMSQLEEDREKVMKELEEREAVTSQLSQEKQHLSDTTEQLRQRLQDIEKQRENIRTETKQAEDRISDNLERLQQLEHEKLVISEHAQELQSTIKDLKAQKEVTEKELREEIKARMSAEERLREAERSLTKLDNAVQTQTPNIEDDVREEMTTSVKKLKSFFEELAMESIISAQKPLIVRNAVTSWKTMVKRSKTVKYEHCKQMRKSWTPDGQRSRQQVRRAVTSVSPSSLSGYNNRNSSTPTGVADRVAFEDQI